MDTIEKTRLAVAITSIALLLGGLFLLGLLAPQPQATINGDTLGRWSGETTSEYVQRAAQSLDDVDATQPSFALLTFAEPLDNAGMQALLGDPNFPDFTRVNSLVIGSAAAIDLPEPTADATRMDVIRQQLGFQGLPVANCVGLVVYAPQEQLAQAAELEEVLAVQALPSDARWGAFGIRVNPDYVSPAIVVAPDVAADQ
ncbi:MAG: hypothetical protein Q3976_04745 [Corynebacterium sp.]|nr:hypothetical protein [Corynebacterium sp.]